MEHIEEVMVLEDLKGEELEGAFIENLLEIDGIESYRVQIIRRLFVELTSELLKLNYLHELLLKGINYRHALLTIVSISTLQRIIFTALLAESISTILLNYALPRLFLL